MRVNEKTDVAPAIDKALQHPGPVVIEFEVEQHEDTFPAVPPGAALGETVDQPQFEDEPEPKKVRSS